MLALRIGLRSLLADWGTLLFTTLALAAVLGPLLLLLGMKNGILGALLDQMRSNISNYEVIVLGDHSLTPEAYTEIAGLDHIGFVVPMIRSIAAHLEFEKPEGSRRIFATVQTTAPRDPLARGGSWPSAPDQIALSASLAQYLAVGVGDDIVARNERIARDGSREKITFAQKVVAIVPRDLEQRDRAFAVVDVLADLEAFLDGYEVPHRGIAGQPSQTRALAYASFRIYADRIEEVAKVDEALRARGFDTRSNRSEIANILALDRNLTQLFLLIATVGMGSYFICLAASLGAGLARNRRQLSLFKLFGATQTSLLLFSLAQSLGVATLGTLLSALFYQSMGAVVDLLFASTLPGGRSLVRLHSADCALIALVTLAGATLIAVGMARVLSRVPPGEVLRDAT